MDELINNYSLTLMALGAMSGLMLLQILVVDVIGIRRGHMPGKPVDSNHDDLLFRATRAHANTNESISAFILVILFCLLSRASPAWVNGLACAFVATRFLYTACYYSNLKTLRSVIFGVSLLMLAGLLVTGFGFI